MMGIVAFLDDIKAEGLGDEGAGTVDAVELLTALVELDEEIVGGNGFSRLDDGLHDVAEGGLDDIVLARGWRHRLARCCLRHVVAAYCEVESCIGGTTAGALDEPYLGPVVLGSDGKDVVRAREENPAEVSCS